MISASSYKGSFEYIIEIMLHVILRNRTFFVLTLVVIWFFIFIIPRIGQYYRLENDFKSSSKKSPTVRKDLKELKKNPEENKQINNVEDDSIDYLYAGEFRQGDKCLDSLDGNEGSTPGLWQCHGEGRNQFWFIMKKSLALRNKELCLQGSSNDKSISLQACQDNDKQGWVYEEETLHLTDSSLCLGLNSNGLSLEECNGKDSQKWRLKTPPGM